MKRGKNKSRQVSAAPAGVPNEPGSSSVLRGDDGPGTTESSTETVVPSAQFIAEPLKTEDIGGELLPILSRGLYTDPFHALREYVQNAVDAAASLVTIKRTGNSLLVHDDGAGMSYQDLINARRFGVSQKTSEQHVGFRGIGIYSGYDLCNRLLVTTSVAGEPSQSVLEFNFGAMKKRLAADRAGKTGVTPLLELLQRYSRFTREPASPGTSGTTVELEEISDYHINRLRNTEALTSYVLRNLPVDFESAFPHRDAIKSYLSNEVPGYKAVRILLEINPGERVEVARPTIPNLEAPKFKVLEVGNRKVAVIWSSLYTGEGKRGKIPEKYSDRGFVYKVKGFTIGDNTRLQQLFKTGSATLYYWYTGEIYVVDDQVIPNTERNAFEANRSYEVLQSAVADYLKTLEQEASRFQTEQKATENLRKYKAQLDRIETEIAAGIGDRISQSHEVEGVLEDLKKQKGRSAELKDEWKAAEKQAQQLRVTIRGLIEKPSKNRKPSSPAEESPESKKGTEDQSKKPGKPRLTDLADAAGIELSADVATILDLIQDALSTVLNESSPEYEALLSEIEASIEREFGDNG